MSPAPPCYYIEPSEDDVEDVRLGMAWLREAMSRAPNRPPEGLVLTGVRRVLTNSIPLCGLGSHLAHALSTGADVSFGGGTITNLTEQHHPSVWRGPVFALYPNMKTMGIVDDMFGVTEVLALPGHVDMSGWVTRRNAIELRSQSAPEAPRLHPVLMAALDGLALGCGHKGLGLDDRDGVTETFLHLRQAGIPFTGEDTRNYLMGKHRWVSIAADYAKKRADDINAGKQIRWPRHRHFVPEVVNYWREKAEAPVA